MTKIKLSLAILLSIISIQNALAASFNELRNIIDRHSQIKSLQQEILAIEEQGKAKSKWAEPQLKLDAMNFPLENIQMGQSAMTSIGATLSQNIPLNNKYSHIKESYLQQAKSKERQQEILQRNIALKLWNHAIEKDNLKRSKQVLKENLLWIEDMLQVSTKLYATGKISQQAILDLKIRKSQISSDITAKEIKLEELNKNLERLLDSPNKGLTLDLNSVEWSKLDSYLQNHQDKNPKEEFLALKIDALYHLQRANYQNKTPEINFGLNYRYRDNFDVNGDFIGAFIAIPISTGARLYNYNASSYDYAKAKYDLQTYENNLASLKEELQLKIKNLETELNILTTQTIIFAQTSRTVTSKSYAVGRADYLELLRSELQLQNLLLKKIGLESQIRTNKALYIFETGMNF